VKHTTRYPGLAKEMVQAHKAQAQLRQEACERCGCTDTSACNPPCGWVRPGLCSNCASPADYEDMDAEQILQFI
jgi:hypothetical protein